MNRERVLKALADLKSGFAGHWQLIENKKYHGGEDRRVWGRVVSAMSILIEEVKSQSAREVDVQVVLEPGATMPQYQTDGAAGMDLHAFLKNGDMVVTAGATAIVPTGVKMAIPEGFEGQVRPRSGASSRGFVAVFGTIDCDYRGEIGIIFHNASNEPRVIRSGDRLAQLVIVPVWRASLQKVDVLSSTNRGEKGFGSTGK